MSPSSQRAGVHQITTLGTADGPPALASLGLPRHKTHLHMDTHLAHTHKWIQVTHACTRTTRTHIFYVPKFVRKVCVKRAQNQVTWRKQRCNCSLTTAVQDRHNLHTRAQRVEKHKRESANSFRGFLVTIVFISQRPHGHPKIISASNSSHRPTPPYTHTHIESHAAHFIRHTCSWLPPAHSFAESVRSRRHVGSGRERGFMSSARLLTRDVNPRLATRACRDQVRTC